MLALCITNQKLFNVDNIQGDKVKLVDQATGKPKLVQQSTFKKTYKLVDGIPTITPEIPTPEDEVLESTERASEVIDEAAGKNDTLVRVPDLTQVAKEGKPIKTPKNKPSQKKESPKANKSLSKDKGKVGKVVTLHDICTELKVDPMKARRILRKKFTKPEAGWEWTNPKQIAEIKAALKK